MSFSNSLATQNNRNKIKKIRRMVRITSLYNEAELKELSVEELEGLEKKLLIPLLLKTSFKKRHHK
jgi:hypothetical protein